MTLPVLLLAAPADIPRLTEVAIDERVLLVVLAITVAVGFIFGLVPIAQARRADLQAVLKSEQGRGASAGRESAAARAGLMVGEIALAVVLVIGAGLLIKSFWHLQQVKPGFDAERVVKAEFQLPGTRYPTDFKVFPKFKEIHQFNAALMERVSAIPGVESAAIAGNHPLDAGFTNSFAVIGREAEARDWPEILVRRATPGYFRTLRIPLVRGRLLSESDRRTRLRWCSSTRLRQRDSSRRRSHGSADGFVWRTTDDRRSCPQREDSWTHRGLRRLRAYLPFAQAPWSNGTVLVRRRAVIPL